MAPPHATDERFAVTPPSGDDGDPVGQRPRPEDLNRARGRPTDVVPRPNGQGTTLDAKLARRMRQLGLSQQALAQKSGVSDSEISRLLKGQSKRPGLRNILKIARALGVSVDFLADDTLHADPLSPSESLPSDEQALLDRARALGLREVGMLLDATRILGFETAIRRLYGVEPRLFSDSGGPEG